MRYRLFRWLFKYLGFILSVFERFYLDRYSKNNINHPIIFIIGAPRSGSTILYQLITSFFDVIYINNLMDAARQNINVGYTLSKLFFRGKGHQSFQSSYGKTIGEGLNAPAEGRFWYKWLPKAYHHLTRTDIGENEKQQIKMRFNCLINRSQKPLIIKNLAFSVRLDLLNELFPNAYFIFITRDKTAQTLSILNARKKNHIPENKFWSIRPENYKDLEQESDEVMMIIKQIFYIEKEINNDLQLFADDHIIKIKYEDLLKDPRGILKIIEQRLYLGTRNEFLCLPNLDIKEKKADSNLLKKINQYISSFNWESYYEHRT
jgi:hypothetical protein